MVDGRGLYIEEENALADRVDHLSAMVLAHRLLTDALVHALCLGENGLSRTSILRVLDVVHDEIDGHPGTDDVLIQAFREHRDSLRQLLLDGAIEELRSTSFSKRPG